MGNVLKIRRMTNKDEQFYPTIGPWLSRRSVVNELGSPLWDDDGKDWFVAFRGRKLVGFAALRRVGKHLSLVSAYVLPEHRRQGVYSALLHARLEAAGSEVLKAVASADAVPALKRAGLKQTSVRGKYSVMERAQ